MVASEERYILDAGSLGFLEGVAISSDGVPALQYLGGLPYALPPTGQYRFRTPRKLPSDYTYGTKESPGRFTKGCKVCPQPLSRVRIDTALFDEDCLQLNIWIPAGETPTEGWPVFFYLHGGFLQRGTANWKIMSLVPLLSESAFRAIVVLPAYRLNALGFLTGNAFAAEADAVHGTSFGNMGFWDQRTALEWVHRSIANFGGNPGNITVGGYSAGGYSAFHQLTHELYYVPAEKNIIKRVFMLSNGPGLRAKNISQHQSQFEEFIEKLGIPCDLEGKEKLARLRQLPYQQLIDVQTKMKISEFRPLCDDKFHPRGLFLQINSGNFAHRMKVRGISLLSGECRDEHAIYRTWRPPEDSFDSLQARLCAEYSEDDVAKILDFYCGPQKELPADCKDWRHLFGRIYADIQVHYLQRGFHNKLIQGGLEPGKDLLRYRFDRRLKCLDATMPARLGVSHSSDVPIWLWGSDFPGGLTEQEKIWLRGWNEEFAAFVAGEKVNWGTTGPRQMRRWRADGITDIWEDDRWERGLEMWDLIHMELPSIE